MDNEELEQIPWSALVADVDDRPDRRWYLVGAGVAVLAIGWFAMQTLLPAGQPMPEASPPMVSEVSPPTTEATPALVVSEDDLRSGVEAGSGSEDERLAIVRAEWFVTDWHTSDGSGETRAAISAALVEPLAPADPTDGGGQTYVEWARATSVVPDDEGFTVTVAYRTVSTLDGSSFVRDPVSAATVDVVFVEGVPLIAAAPKAESDPWPRSG